MKRLLIFAAAGAILLVLAVAALVVVQMLRSDDANLATSAPAIPTATGPDVAPTRAATTATAPSTPSAAATAAPVAPTAASPGVVHFVIDSSGASSAKYVVNEKLARLPVESDAVGETKDVTGDIYLTPTGLATGNKSSFKVDLRTIKSDEGLRDRFVRENTLETNKFPFAEFEVTSITGFPANYVEGTEVSVSIAGNMTIHGVTKPITFASKARRAGTALTGIADTDFKMSDFGISAPRTPIATSKDALHIQIVIVAKQA